MALLVIASLAIGWVLSSEKSDQRVTTSLVTAMRNPGLALMLANQYGQEMISLKPAILNYVLTTLLVSWPVVRRARSVHS
jgi:predicted Na+-dependent transporter